VVAINTHRLGEGFYLGLPADESLRDRLAALSRGEAPARVRLGVAIAPPHVARRLRAAVGLEPRDGLLVRAVEDGGPAERAGVRAGDLIVAIAPGGGGEETVLSTPDELHDALDAAGPGASVQLRILRGGDETSVVVGLGG